MSSLHMQGTHYPQACRQLCSFAYLWFFRSSVVEKVLLGAHSDGRQFSVVVVDSRPMLEGTVIFTT